MRGLAGADQRPFEEIFVHERFRPSSVERLDDETVGDIPDDVHAAVSQLPSEDLQTIAHTVLGQYGGLLTRREFGDVFGPREIRWASAEFLRAFGSAGLGTVGHIDLQSRGLGILSEGLEYGRDGEQAAGVGLGLKDGLQGVQLRGGGPIVVEGRLKGYFA